jgi:hypothetical protein
MIELFKRNRFVQWPFVIICYAFLIPVSVIIIAGVAITWPFHKLGD